MRDSDFILLPYSTRSPIEFSIPLLFYQDGGLFDIPSEDSTLPSHSSCLTKLLNIWSTDYMHRSFYEDGVFHTCFSQIFAQFLFLGNSSFSFLSLLDLSVSDV